MLDLFSIFSKGGIVLWCFQSTGEMFSPSVNALIRSVILQVSTYLPILLEAWVWIVYNLISDSDTWKSPCYVPPANIKFSLETVSMSLPTQIFQGNFKKGLVFGFRSVQVTILIIITRWRCNTSLTMSLSWYLWLHTSVFCSYHTLISSSMTYTWSLGISTRMSLPKATKWWTLISWRHLTASWGMLKNGVSFFKLLWSEFLLNTYITWVFIAYYLCLVCPCNICI